LLRFYFNKKYFKNKENYEKVILSIK